MGRPIQTVADARAERHARTFTAQQVTLDPHVAQLASLLEPGGILHLATDWAPYAEVMLDVVAAEPGLHNPHGRPAPRPDPRPLTKFEKRGLDLGHEIVDIVAVRRGPGAQ